MEKFLTIVTKSQRYPDCIHLNTYPWGPNFVQVYHITSCFEAQGYRKFEKEWEMHRVTSDLP